MNKWKHQLGNTKGLTVIITDKRRPHVGDKINDKKREYIDVMIKLREKKRGRLMRLWIM